MGSLPKSDIETFDALGETYTYSRSIHVNQRRAGAHSNARDQYIDNPRYIAILTTALQQGLTEYRNKGKVVLWVFDAKGYPYHFVVTLVGNHIQIITVFRGYRELPHAFQFKLEHQRLNLWHYYTIPRMTYEEQQASRFLKSMGGVRKLK